MEEEFTCPICLEVAEDAVETSCCHHIYCQKCIDDMPVSMRRCPQCRSLFTANVTYVVRRMIGNLSVNCPYQCNSKITRSELEAHKINCLKNVYQCPAPHCTFKAAKDTFANHLIDKHKDELVKNASKCFETIESPNKGLDSTLLYELWKITLRTLTGLNWPLDRNVLSLCIICFVLGILTATLSIVLIQ